MRIGMNLIPLRPGQMGGAEVYFRDLLAELLRRGEHEYVLVTADDNHDTLPADSAVCRRVLFARGAAGAAAPLQGVAGILHGGMAGLRQAYERRVPMGARDIARPLLRPGVRAGHMMSRGLDRLRNRARRRRSDRLREVIRDERIDIWFCPFTNLEPRVCPVPAVITVYDLQHEHLPELFDAAELRHRRQLYPESCVAADHVIAISEFTRQGVIEHYGVEPTRVSTISLAAGSDFGWRDAAARVAEVRQRYGLPARYVFYPANTWRHKNHARLIDALARYRQETGEALTLVLTGVSKEGETALAEAVDREGLRASVRVLGFVPRADLPALYTGAACLVFASLFEGFGIPLVEAMLVGCPIAASNATSIPEVVGDAAVLFDPRDPADIARAIAAIVRDPTAAAELARRGRARVERFSVSKTADLTLELLNRVRRDGLVRPPATGRELTWRLNSTRPLVTIVTPSFNQGRFIRETIESVLTQSYSEIEYLVMDGGSTDETIDVLRTYGDRLAWVSERDRGQADAINKGWRRTRGAIVAFLNSDDTYLPGAVEHAVACLVEHPEAGAVYGEGYHVDEQGRIIRRYPTEPFSMARLEETCFICQPTVFLRRELVERVGYLDESLRYCMDYDLWIRAARVAQFVFTPRYLAATRVHAETKTLGQRVPAHAEIMTMVRRHFGHVSASWVYAYACAVLGPPRRENAWADARFVGRLVAVSLMQFLRQNRRVPLAEWRRWEGWLRHAWRQHRQRRS